MTDQEIYSLRCGDIILIDRGERSYFRTVIEGPADANWTSGSVTVPIRRRSWTNRAHTILDKHFLRTNGFYTGMKAKKLLGGDELSRLMDMGFNVAKELVRELREAADAKVRYTANPFPSSTRLKPDRCKTISERVLKTALAIK